MSLIELHNPSTGEPIATYSGWTPREIEEAVTKAHHASRQWAQAPLTDRIDAIAALAATLRANVDKLATLTVQEMGKPLAEARGEVEKSAITAAYYAANGSQILGDEPVALDTGEAWIAYEPIGLVLAVMPWNFPIWQVMRFAIPSLLAGNGILLKHSPNVTGCALSLEEVIAQSGFPKHLFTTLVIAEPDVPDAISRLIEDERIAAVTLTGSNRAGASVGAAAGRATKKSVLELGGSDAFIVLADADVEAAAAAAVRARFANCGQSCVCAKRFIVEATVSDSFTDAFLTGVKDLVVGDPLDHGTQVGPLARADLRDAIHRQVQLSLDAGATLIAGGEPQPGPGYFYAPTVLTDTGPGVAAFDEETFGPLAAISVAKDEEDAIRLANATRYGLGLSIWTSFPARGVTVAKRITTGAVFINGIVASDPRLPFGGTKASGYGRELAVHGAREFTNMRTYVVND